MYTTQIDAARKGILTEQMKRVAEKEHMDPSLLMERVARGEIAIPANKNHKSLLAEGVGTGLSTKINVNLGISRDCPDVDKELEKVDRKSTRLNSSHANISYAVFCLKKK